MGADEFTPLANDAGVSIIDSPANGFCGTLTNKNVKAKLKNYGTSALTSAYICWQVNGVNQTPYSYSGSLASGATTSSITLGTYTFNANTSYTIKVYDSLPNGGSDGNNLNDTLTKTIGSALSGTFTIGGTTPDYANFTSAITALNTRGVCGPVTFKVRDGVYNEGITLTGISGASFANRVTFTSQSNDSSKVTLNYTTSTSTNTLGVVNIFSTSYLTIKNMTIYANATGNYCTGVVLAGGSNYDSISHCVIRMGSGITYPYGIYMYYYYGSSYYSNHSNVIDGNFIRRPYYGVYAYCYTGTYPYTADSNKIINNIFDSTSSTYGIYGYYNNAMVVSGNTFRNTVATQFYGIYDYAYYTAIGLNFNNNKLYSPNSYGYGVYSIYNGYGTTQTDVLRIYNNMISYGAANNGTTYGIYPYYSYNYACYNNSVSISGTNTVSAPMYPTYTSGDTVKNNIFANFGGGYAYYNLYGSPSIVNYNDLWTTGSVIGNNSGTTYASFSAWKSGTGYEANGVNVDPKFYDNNTNLHAKAAGINNVANSWAYFAGKKDIDGDTRSASTPDMGADEFTPPAADAGLTSIDSPSAFCSSYSGNLVFKLKNYGTSSLTSVDIVYSINGGTPSTYSWSGSGLAQNATVQVAVGAVSFGSTNTTVKAWVVNPNGVTDGDASNDTVQDNSIQPSISGVKTIGGTSPDYATVTAALAALNTKGVCGPTTFLIRPGSYSGQYNIGAIQGASAVNTITFKSSTGVNTDVTLKYPALGTATSNYVVNLNGAQYFTFKNLTITRILSNTYSQVVLLNNGASNDSFVNCRIIGENIGATYVANKPCINVDPLTKSCNNLVFTGNTIRYGGDGLFIAQNTFTTDYHAGVVVTNNTVDSACRYGMIVQLCYQPTVSGNTISNLQQNTGSNYGLYMSSDSGSFNINNNNVYLPNGGFGLALGTFPNTTNTTPVKVYNNFINVGGGSSIPTYGLYDFGGVGYDEIVYNTVKSTNPTTTYPAYYGLRSVSTGTDLINNVFANTGGGYALYTSSSSYLDSAVNNDLYSTGTNLAYYSGSTYTALSSLASGSGKFGNCVSTDPSFLSATNLHVQAAALNAAGVPSWNITTDYDGQARDASTPDMGADEFTPSPIDAGISAFTSPTAGFCSGSNSIIATIKNYGTSTLTSADIRWYINGTAQTTYSWTGSIASGSSASVYLGTATLTTGLNSIAAVAANANSSGPDGNTTNDSFNYSAQSALSGTYVIGTGGDYLTFAAAKADLASRGVCGAVVFNVKTGTYNEQMSLSTYAGMSPSNTVTFQAQSGDSSKSILTWSASTSSINNWTVDLNGAKYYIFKKITIARDGSSTYGNVINMRNSSLFNKFQNCILITTASTSSQQNVIYAASPSTDSSNVFNNNIIRGGYYGIYMYGRTSAPYLRNNQFTNNRIDSFLASGTYFYYNNDLNFSNNIIRDGQGSSYSGTSGFFSYYLYNTTGLTKIDGNNINMGPLSYGSYGMYLYYTQGTGTFPVRVSNNMVTNPSGQLYYYYNNAAIYTYYGSFINIYHNSIFEANTTNGTYPYYGGGLFNNYATHLKIFNNITVIDNGGLGYAGYYAGVNSSYVDSMDYNDYWVRTAGSIGSTNYSTYSTLASWKSAVGSSYESNSKNINPNWTNIAGNVFDVGNKASLNNLGKGYRGITTDYYGTARLVATPDMGANEFTPPANDAGVASIDTPASGYCPGTKPVYVTIKNYGTATLTSVDISYSVNGGSTTTYSWSGSVAAGASTQVNIGSASFTSGTYSLRVLTSNPNGGSDGDTTNDRITKNNIGQALTGTYTIGGTSPNYSTINAAITDLYAKGVCGPVVFNIRPGAYNERMLFTGPIGGASATNTVTFQGTSSDSTKTRIYYAATSSYGAVNPTIDLNNVSYLVFQKLWLDRPAPGTYYYDGSVVQFRNVSNYNTITNCYITGYAQFMYYQYQALIYSSGTNDNNNTFTNNRFRGGYAALYWFGASAGSQEQGNRFDNNLFDSGYYYNTQIYYNQGLKFGYNQCTNLQYANYGYGAYFYYCYDIAYLRNNVFNNTSGYYALYMQYCQASSSSAPRGLVANNFINLGGSYAQYAWYNYYFNNLNIYNNTVRYSSGYSGSYAAYFYPSGSSPYPDLVNNIFVSANSGNFALSNYSYGYYRSINYNDYYNAAGGSSLVYWNYSSYSTLAAYKSASGKDSNGLNIDPSFAATNDYHINSTALNGAGKNLSSIVNNDLDGETRSSTMDPGADEFTPPANDAKMASVDSPVVYCGGGSSNIKATLFNQGTSTLTSVDIKWYVNSVYQGTYSWSGSLASGASTAVTVGTYAFSTGSYNVAVRSTNPNGSTDGNTANDSAYKLNISAGLSGTYTIGSSGTYSNFSSAISDLYTYGLCGPVVFNVQSGSYNERAVFSGAISGASPINTVTFQSAAGDSSKARIYYNASSSYGSVTATVEFNGVSYVNFKKLWIDRPSTYSYNYDGASVNFLGGASNNTVTNCLVTGQRPYAYPAYYQYQARFYGAASATNNNILNNDIRGGYSSFYLSAGTGWNIQGNRSDSVYYYNAYIQTTTGLIFGYNTLTNYTNTSMQYSVYLYSNTDIVSFRNNKVYMPYGYYGIYMYGNTQSVSGNRTLIANNFIYGSGSNCYYTVYSYYNQNMRWINNSIYHNSGYSSSGYYGMYLYNYSGSLHEFVNNIVVCNVASEAGLYLYNSGNYRSIDYNDYYNTAGGSSLVNYNGTNYTSLATYKSSTGRDSNSISVNPSYNAPSTGDLHINSTALNGSGKTYNTEITNDIDGEARSSSMDMGADEFTPPANDAKIVSIDSPVVYCGGGSQNIKATLINQGTATLTSADIKWYVNSVYQGTYSWTGSLASGSTAQVTVGSYAFTSGSYSVQVRSTNPNGTIDGNPANDSLSKSGITAGMSGTYTIGSSGTYSSFALAIADLYAKGVCGPVVFNVATGSYSGRAVFNGAINGASAINTITFQSTAGDSSKARLYSNASSSYGVVTATVEFKNVSYVIFKKLWIDRVSSYTYNYDASVISFTGGANYNQVTNCKITGQRPYSYPTYYQYQSMIYDATGSDNNNTISYNNIVGGYTSFYFVSGNTGTTIIGNISDSVYYYNAYIQNQTGLVFNNNTITNTANSTTIQYPLYLSSNTSIATISANKIYAPQGYYGLYMYGNQQSSSGVRTLISNNFIYGGGANMNYTVYSYYNQNMRWINNSIYDNSTYGGNYAMYMYNFVGSYNEFVNNIVATSNANKPTVYMYNYGYYRSIDYNDYYSSGGATNLINYNGTNYSTFSAYKTGSGRDSNGFNVNPSFAAASSGDFHITQTALNGTAKSYNTEVPTDIDGDARTSTMDVGADEFTPPANDASIASIDTPQTAGCGTQRIVVTLSNSGTATLTSVDIRWRVNGIASTYSWSGSLASGATQSIYLGSVSYTSGTYVLSARTLNPNGGADGNTANDSVGKSTTVGMTGTYVIGSSPSDYTTIGAAVYDLSTRGLCGAATFNIKTGTYSENLTIPAIAGSSATNTVTFQSSASDSSKVIITNSFSNYNQTDAVVRFAGAQYVNFKKLTIDNSSQLYYYYGSAVTIYNNSSNINLTNCRIWGIRNPVYAGYYQYVVAAPTYNSLDTAISITNNAVRGGNFQIYTYNSSNSYSGNKGWVINGNNFDSIWYYGIYKYYYAQRWTINNNTFNWHPSSYSSSYGLYCYYNYYNTNWLTETVSGNKFNLPTNSNTTYGVYRYYCYSFSPTGYNSRFRFFNNFIAVRGSGTQYGYYEYYNSNNDVFNNNVSITGSGTLYGFYIPSSYGATNGWVFRGNNLYSSQTSSNPVWYMASASTSSVVSNNNNFYIAGGNMVYYNGTTYSSLSSYKSGTSQDANSYNVNPNYNSSTDLHVTNCALKNKGWVLSSAFNYDIDGQSRGTYPDLGADEFTGTTGVWAANALDSAWSNTENWCDGTLPLTTTSVVVDVTNSPSHPVISSGTAAANTITQTSLVTKLRGGQLDLKSSWTGSLVATGGTLNFMGSATQSIPSQQYYSVMASNGVKNLGGNVTLNGDLTINDAATLNIGANTFKLGGILTQNGTGALNGGSTSKVYVQNNAADTITFKPITLSVFKVTRTKGARLDNGATAGKMTVNDSLILSRGHLRNNTGSAKDTVATGSASTFVDETSGYFVYGVFQAYPQALPLGTLVAFPNGINMTRTGGLNNPGTVTVRRFLANDPALFTSYPLVHGALSYGRMNERWTFDGTNPVTTGYKITTDFKYSDSALILNGRSESLLNLFARSNSGTQYLWQGRTALNTSTNTLTDTVSHFSDWLIGGGTDPLPVELINFTASLRDAQSTNLNWITASEINNSHFEIERSIDGKEWLYVGQVKGNGTTNTIMNYSFVDRFGLAITSPILYYRLKQVDYNGAYEYSDVRKVTLNAKADGIKAWYNRNITKAQVTITLASEKQVSVTLMTMDGKILGTKDGDMIKGSTLVEFDMANYAKGAYIIIVNTGTDVVNQKFIKY